MRQEGIDLLKQHFQDVEIWPENRACPRELLLQKAAEVDAILSQMGDKIDEEVLCHENLKIVSQIAVGLDNIDLQAATKHKIVISHTPGVLTEACADHAWAMMLAAARLIVQSNRYVVNGEWVTQDPMAFLGASVYGQTLGIVGPGRIGLATAKRASGFNMKVLYHGPHQKQDFDQIGATYYPDLAKMLPEVDFLIITCLLNDSTRGMIGMDQLKLMKKTAILVNIGRGPMIKTDELYTALKDGVIGSAALDVVDPEPLPKEHPLNTLDNCIVVSHIASATIPTRAKMAEIAAQAIIDCLNGKKVTHCANPAVYDE